MISTVTLTQGLPARHRARLLRFARDAAFTPGTRLFEEGCRADRFWVLKSGTVALDMRMPGRRAPVLETVGADELVGWSWLFSPYVWRLGAEALTPVRAHEFDAMAVRLMCQDDRDLGMEVWRWVGKVLCHRLAATRSLLLDVYEPSGDAETLRAG
ncbi:cyclic nucleotide-binding domain-containing protein [Streptomyces sp. NPDC059009]|uniref:cyclic nucleotide-binding domain-containing protein n=1 Tax=Streptomyces sp. NPDC059009 TaxID=3346694 RepID=UPI00368B22B5